MIAFSGDCPCGRRNRAGHMLAHAQCCGRYLVDFAATPAPDAEALMRSRYCAFVFERADYLLATWLPDARPAEISFDPGVKWLGLEVRDHRPIDATHAEVEFVARQRDRTGRAVRLHERSRFVREDLGAGQRWYYLNGDMK